MGNPLATLLNNHGTGSNDHDHSPVNLDTNKFNGLQAGESSFLNFHGAKKLTVSALFLGAFGLLLASSSVFMDRTDSYYVPIIGGLLLVCASVLLFLGSRSNSRD